jgi:hypothetical protein
MTKKYEYDTVFKYFKDRGYALLDKKYLGVYEKLSILDVEGYKYHISYGCFKSAEKNCKFDKYNPEKFSKRNKYTYKNIELWINKNDKNFELSGGKYINNREKTLIFFCHECEEDWNTCWDDIYSKGCACPYCAGKRTSKSKNLLVDFPGVAKDWDYNKNIFPPDKYSRGSKKKVYWLCENGHSWESNISNRTFLGEGCPICSFSHGEKKIYEILINKNISFTPQKTFKNCRGMNFGLLKFDFCVYDDCGNILFLIEFQGKQHFFIVDYFDGEYGYLKRQTHDSYKKYYCYKYGFRLLIIKYDEINNIENILERELSPLLKGGNIG